MYDLQNLQEHLSLVKFFITLLKLSKDSSDLIFLGKSDPNCGTR